MTNHYQLGTEQQKKLEAKQQELMVEVLAKRMTPDQASQQLAAIVNPQFSSKLLESPTQTPQGLMGQGVDTPMLPHWNTGGQATTGPAYSGGMQELTSMQMGDGSGRPPQNTGGPVPQGASVGSQGLINIPPKQPQMPEQSIFGRMGDGLKSMGQGMSGYMGKLFNDPNRMALLQGGLSMMDPNSYYDKQGFGSVFTGLNKGLGAAQGGMQGVLDRRKTRADTDKLNRPPAGSNPVAVPTATGKMQNWQNGVKVGPEYDKQYQPARPPEIKKLFDELDQHEEGSPRYKAIEKIIIKKGWMPSQFPSDNSRILQAKPDMAGGIGGDSSYTFTDASAKNPKMYTQPQIQQMREDYDQDGIVLEKMDTMIRLATPENMGVGGWFDKFIDKGKAALPQVATMGGLNAKQTSDATELARLFDNIKSTAFRINMGVAIQGKLIDSPKDRAFMEEVIRDPDRIFTHPTDFKKNMRDFKRILKTLQKRREDTGHVKAPTKNTSDDSFMEKWGNKVKEF